MLYNLPSNCLFGNAPTPIELPDDWDVTVCSFKGENAPVLSRADIEEQLRANPAFEDAKGAKDAVIMFEDTTRPTYFGDIAEIIVDILEEAGVPSEAIRFMAAVGTHRCMTYPDKVVKLGKRICDNYDVFSHNPFYGCEYVGTTSQGIRVELNRDCINADFKVALGTLSPHPGMGIGGAGKIVAVGVASLETIVQSHQAAPHRWTLDAPVLQDNYEAADMLGVNLFVNTILNGAGEISYLYAGGCREVHQESFDTLWDFYETPACDECDIVIANEYFKAPEPGTGLALTGVSDSVREGGILIDSFNTPQYVAPHYGNGVWGQVDGVVGPFFRGHKKIAPNVGKMLVFSTTIDRAVAYSYLPLKDGAIICRTWEDVLSHIEPGPKKVAIYPYTVVSRLVR